MKRSLTYKKAGVDIDKANDFVRSITPLIASTKTGGVLGGIGGFGGLFKIDTKKFKDPVLVASTDGVGTKILLAKKLGIYDTIGIDLVAMCVNDLVVSGAKPLFFLDYFATGKLKPDVSLEIIKGISEGCRAAGAALLGGETAELPGMYQKGDFDLAGFGVGIVERSKIVDGSRVKPGDVALGIQSSGLHSNGFSLVRKVFSGRELAGWLGEAVLRPTIIYVKPILSLLENVKVKSLAHITGGGFFDNIPRAIPKGVDVVIDRNTWPVPPIFGLIKEKADIALKEMFRTFNMGIGMVAILSGHDAPKARTVLKKFQLSSYA
ncbi:MAG: phosphoribosylformylglycinamidine cyclo-ligase, partial [Candidatus Omnitrophota bacterium]